MQQIKNDKAESVEHNAALLDTLLKDAMVQTPIWSPANYWKPYCDRITDEIRRTGMKNFRTNQKILKGYATGGRLLPAMPRATWKKKIWTGLESAPVFSMIVDGYKKVNSAYHKQKVTLECNLSRLALDEIKEKFPSFKPPMGLCNGGAEDKFEWNGHEVSSDWVFILTRIADFYTKVDPKSVQSVLEIGPGLGLSTLAHIALNPYIKNIVNVDIVPVVYVSTQYLRSIPDINVIDYIRVKQSDKIKFPASSGKPNVIQIPPWKLPDLDEKIDYFFNAYSFMEMENDICKNYAEIIKKHVTGGVYLHSHLKGHEVGAGNQKEPVTHKYIESLFSDAYAKAEPATYFWTKYGMGAPEEICFMTREPAD